jgi:hypothetical protein
MSLRVSSIDALPTAALREQARAWLGVKASESLKTERRKFGNKPYTLDDGTRFDSRLEWRCFEWLKARQVGGELLWFTRQVPFELEGGVVYRSDFLAALTGGGVEVIDAKGRDTQASRNKRKQVLARYGVEVRLWPPR